MSERTPPADLTAERMVLGSLLLERDAILVVAPLLRDDDFYLEKHARIYTAMLACLARRVPPDLATVADELRRRDWLDGVGGVAGLGELSAAVPTAVHVAYYAEIVARAAALRRLISTGASITALGYDERSELDLTFDRAEQLLFAITQRQRGADFLPISAVVEAYYERAQRDEDEVIPTGLLDLDKRLNGGLRPGQLALLAGRPGLGKTGLALTIAHHLAVRQGRGVGLVSLEMGRDELLERLLAIHSGVDTRQVQGRIRAGETRLLRALGQVAAAPLAIDDGASTTVLDVRSRARRLAASGPLALLIVDYLQLLLGDSAQVNRVDEVSRISRQLKLLAKELGCPVLALSQLSRAVEGRASKIPQLSDLRESGSLEQDADIVLFIYREEMYAGPSAVPGAAELHLAKHRSGPVGVVPLRFEASTTAFQNLARE